MNALLMSLVAMMPQQAAPQVDVSQSSRKRVEATVARGLQVTRTGIDYGSPTWRAEHRRVLDRAGRLQLRLGGGAWTTWTTTAPLRFGSLRVPAGIWVLGLIREVDGSWKLMLADAVAVTMRGQYPARTREVEPDFVVPLTYATGKAQPTLAIDLVRAASSKHGRAVLPLRLELAWHEHRLGCPVVVELPRLPDQPPTFSRVRNQAFVIERAGQGAVPRRASHREHVILFTIWKKDGTLLDSGHARRDPQVTTPARLQSVWAKHLQRIGPGGRIRFETDQHVVVLDLIELL